ncbi:MAG: type II secretion system protein GspC [Vibrio sp.]
MVLKNNVQDLSQLANKFIKNQEKISVICTLLLTACTAWVVGMLIWNLVSSNSSVNRWAAAPVSVGQANANNIGNNISPLLKANLFGAYILGEQKQIMNSGVVQDAPQTSLNLILVGALSSTNQKTSLAIITSQGSQATYGIGETIEKTRATLQAIYIDRVIIRNQGRDETLMLQGVDYQKASQAQPAQIARNQHSTQKSSGSNASASSSMSDENLSEIRQQLAEDPQKVFQYIRFSQVMEEGKLKGYRVRPGKERSLFDQVGLKDGDIATVLNGQDLTDPSQIASLWKTVLQDSEWNLSVERDGQLHDIYIQF